MIILYRCLSYVFTKHTLLIWHMVPAEEWIAEYASISINVEMSIKIMLMLPYLTDLLMSNIMLSLFHKISIRHYTLIRPRFIFHRSLHGCTTPLKSNVLLGVHLVVTNMQCITYRALRQIFSKGCFQCFNKRSTYGEST